MEENKLIIEEMAKVVQRDMCGDRPCEECNYHGKMKILPRYCGTYLIAKQLYNAGYRKVPDGGCVLDKGQNQNFAKFVMGEQAKTRKETAEKFAERLKERLEINLCLYGSRIVFDGDIDEIAKEITEAKNEPNK